MSPTGTVPGRVPIHRAAEPAPRGARLSCQTESLASPGPPVTVLSLAGEIDTSTHPTATTALLAALDQAPGPLVVDLARLTFCSAAGFGLLGHPTATAAGNDYVLAGLSTHLIRVTGVFWPVDRPHHYPHTEAAVTALRVVAADVTGEAGVTAAAAGDPRPRRACEHPMITPRDPVTVPEERRLWEQIRRLGTTNDMSLDLLDDDALVPAEPARRQPRTGRGADGQP